MLYYLKSTVIDTDDYFNQSLLCIIENDKSGAVGFIINRPFRRTLNELKEFSSLPSFPLYEGGPVDDEHLHFLHRKPDIIKEGKQVSSDIYYSGNFREATNAIAKGILHQNDIRIFVGYCGWDADELEKEMRAGEWEKVDADLFGY